MNQSVRKLLSLILKGLGCLFIVAIAMLIYGFFIEPGLLIANHQTKSDWPLKPIRIVFFSDLHMGSPHINARYVDDLISRINETRPDLILIGGDLLINGVVGGHYVEITEVAFRLAQLKANLGVFAVLGNHDWWNNGDNIIQNLTRAGITVLENESKKLILTPDSTFQLIGIGDHLTGHTNLERAFANVDPSLPAIVFMHDPGAILELRKNFKLAFAGHMHGGQVFVPGIGALVTPSVAPKLWAKGWVDLPIGKLFVSVGIGTSILPLRLNAIPEFVVLDLNSNDAK